MASHKIGLADEVRRTNGLWAKAQMGCRDRTGLLRVVDEVALDIVRRLRTDDFDGVLVGPYRPI